MQDWAALDKLFQDGLQVDHAVPKPSYGKDAPVKVTGMTPGMIGPPKVTAEQQQQKAKAAAKAKKKPSDPNEIWADEEVRDEGDPDEVDDGRKQPDYEIVFKQNVSPEDLYLGIDPLRHSGVSCSDALVLKVVLPETKVADIDLDVRPTFVRLGAPKYKLKVHLGEKVDDQKGNAKWDGDKSTLTVTLPIVHDWESKFTTSVADELD